MKHYICTGTCGGVSDNAGVCQDKNCPMYGTELRACDCGNQNTHKANASLLWCACAEKWGNAAPLLLRVVAGIIFTAHGYQKLTEITIAKLGGFFGSVGIPFPAFFAPIVTYVEIIGGIALIFGFMTHWVSKILALIMLVAVVMVHFDKGLFVAKGGYEFALLLFVTVFSLMISGAGKWSVDGILQKKN